MFSNPVLNTATLILAVLSVLTLAGLIAFLTTNKESNKVKYPGNVKLKKYEFTEPEVEEFELPFRK